MSKITNRGCSEKDRVGEREVREGCEREMRRWDRVTRRPRSVSGLIVKYGCV